MTDDFLHRLRQANYARNQSYQDQTGGQDLPLLFRATELAGEVGELLNVIKKLERSALGWGGKKATREQLLEEIGGVMVVFDLLCMDLRIDIAQVTAGEFNVVSQRLGLDERLDP